MKDIPLLQKAIKETHGCDSKWIESVKVTEKFGSQTAWDGTVEVFELIDHPKATRAYAWTYRDGNQNKTMAILGMSPVDSAQSAVKVAIAAQRKKLTPLDKFLGKTGNLEPVREEPPLTEKEQAEQDERNRQARERCGNRYMQDGD